MSPIHLFIISTFISTSMYLFLHWKTHMRIKYLFIDNVIVIIISWLLEILFLFTLNIPWQYLLIFVLVSIPSIGFFITMIRFGRIPKRHIKARENEIVSPADGNIIYIKKIKAGEIPLSVKGKMISKLEEITKTDILNNDCWLIGINMTLFDVHKNCAPINGKIILKHYTPGKFFSLKNPESETENERNTFVIQNGDYKICIVQIASRLVRKIDNYVSKGDFVKKGDWIGMIRFGSQVDIIIPHNCKVLVNVTNQVYAKKTIIAEF